MRKILMLLMAFLLFAPPCAKAVTEQTITVDFTKVNSTTKPDFKVKYAYGNLKNSDNNFKPGKTTDWADWPFMADGSTPYSMHKIEAIQYTAKGTDGKDYAIEIEFDYSKCPEPNPNYDTGNLNNNYAHYQHPAYNKTWQQGCIVIYSNVVFKVRVKDNMARINKVVFTMPKPTSSFSTTSANTFCTNMMVPANTSETAASSSGVSMNKSTGISTLKAAATPKASNYWGSCATSYWTRTWTRKSSLSTTYSKCPSDMIFMANNTTTIPYATDYPDVITAVSKMAVTFTPYIDPSEPKIEVNGYPHYNGETVRFIDNADIKLCVNKVDSVEDVYKSLIMGYQFTYPKIAYTSNAVKSGVPFVEFNSEKGPFCTGGKKFGFVDTQSNVYDELIATIWASGSTPSSSTSKFSKTVRFKFKDIKNEVGCFESIGALNGDLADESYPGSVNHNKIVTFSQPLLVEGTYLTKVGGAQETYYCYLRDKDGNAIKLVSEGKAFPTSYRKGQIVKPYGLAGIYDYNEAMPRINVYGNGFDNFDLFKTTLDRAAAEEGTVITAEDFPALVPVTAIAETDINKFVRLSGVKVNNRKAALADGSEIQLYTRLWKNAAGEEVNLSLEGLENGKEYDIEGFVGQVGTQIALFPTAINKAASAPVLKAPNRISGELVNGAIEAQAISDAVTITVDSPEEGVTYVAQINGVDVEADKADDPVEPADPTEPAEPTTAAAPSWTIRYDADDASASDYVVEDGKKVCVIEVWSVKNGVKSELSTKVRIIHQEAEKVESIKAFKEIYFGKENEVPAAGTKYYQMTGEATIIAKTPYYLYVKGNVAADDSNLGRLLLYNANGWGENPMVDDNGTYRTLQEGDVITGFAIMPEVTEMGNLISNTTGFARTVKLAGHNADYELDAEGNPHVYKTVTAGIDAKIAEADRMMLYTFKGVEVEKTADGAYNLLLDDGQKLPMTDKLFTVRDGWKSAWQANHAFDITGLILKDNNAVDHQYVISMTGYDAGENTDPIAVLALEGYENPQDEVQYFPVSGKVEIKLGDNADTNDVIYYTIDGSDPLQNPEGRLVYSAPIELTADRTIIRAYAARPGANPSAVITRTFVKQTREFSYILNFVHSAVADQYYHFNGIVKIVNVGPQHLFVRGTAGHYLSIFNEGGWTGKYNVGDYITDFVIGAETDENGTVLGAKTLDGGSSFKAAIEAPAGADAIEAVPDLVETLSAKQLRRLVKVQGVKLSGGVARSAAWQVVDRSGKAFDLAVGAAGDIEMPEAGGNGSYDIEGYVMQGEGGALELWPTSITEILATRDVTFTVNGVGVSGSASFEGSATVTLASGSAGAKIYYSFDGEKWAEYGFPFVVTGSTTVQAYAQAPNLAQSGLTTLALTCIEKTPQSGAVYFIVTPDAAGGKVTVAVKPVEVPAKSYSIHYTLDGTAPSAASSKYDDATGIVLTSNTVVKAVMIEEGAEVGPVSMTHVTVPEATTPAGKMSGRLKFSTDSESTPGHVLVTIEPEAELTPGTYQIYYTTKGGELTKENGTLYEKPIDVTETTMLQAILLESGKEAGEVCYHNVWVNPGVTGIEGIEGTEGEGIRVEGNSIVAPEGSEVFDLNGRRVNPNGLASGIYIVRTADGKATKVRI